MLVNKADRRNDLHNLKVIAISNTTLMAVADDNHGRGSKVVVVVEVTILAYAGGLWATRNSIAESNLLTNGTEDCRELLRSLRCTIRYGRYPLVHIQDSTCISSTFENMTACRNIMWFMVV